MAVAVDISGSNYLSYSPLNDKHNILYSGARNSFNQRYKQKPWFRLNPCTDKGVRKGENIDRYDPENDTELSLLQSLVIVEDYFSDAPQLIKEFNISEFWDFLFSDSWSSGHYVRVFEGQLLDMIFSCLMSLTHSYKVVQHETKAFAKNKRLKYSTMKQEKKTEADQILCTETLLLKFIYYGHVVKPTFFDQESSLGYPDMTTTATNSSWHHEAIAKDSKVYGETSSTICVRTSDLKSPSPPPIKVNSINHHPRKARVRASSKTFFRLENERVSMSRFTSQNDSFLPNLQIQRGSNYRYTCSNFSNASDDYKSLPPKVDLNHFICTEKVSYLGESAVYLGEFQLPPEDSTEDDNDDNDDDTDNDDDNDDDDKDNDDYNDNDDDNDNDDYNDDDHDDDENFGQYFYLGGADKPVKGDVPESAMVKLRKRKEIVQQNRNKKKQLIAQRKQSGLIAQRKQSGDKIMPEFSELDVKKYVKDHEVPQIIAVPKNETVPTLEEYAENLEADLKREARLKDKTMASRTAKKSAINFGKFGIAFSFTGLKAGTDVKSLNNKTSAQRMIMIETLMKARKKKQKVPERTNKIVVPLVYISTPSGLTFLHPVSTPLLKKKNVEERHLAYIGQTGPKFPKIKLVPSNEMESPDEQDSEEDAEDIDEGEFNSKKLNIKYSTERMRKVKAAIRAEERRNKSHIYDLLKKYCRMQSVFKAFSGPQKKRHKSSVAGLPFGTSIKKKKKKTPKSSENIEPECNAFVNVGKLKKFAFLEANEKAKTPSSEQLKSLFNNYPMDLFCENLERALKDFVVRREIVISDYNGKTLVSLTFTKKSVFTSSKYSVHQ